MSGLSPISRQGSVDMQIPAHTVCTCAQIPACAQILTRPACVCMAAQIGMLVCAKAVPGAEGPLDTRTPRQAEPGPAPKLNVGDLK
jgi:hypothetical protein